MRVAFCGLGRMGAPMAMHVVRAGHDLTVWNRTPGKAAALVTAGATEAETPAAATRDAEVVVTMLFGPDAVRDVLLGADGVVQGAARETLVIECSTIGRDVAVALAGRLASAGLSLVDAPVAGSVGPASDGTLGVLAGGSDEDFARARPLLELWGDSEKVHHLGPVGSGSAAKLALNLTLGVATAAIGEALRLGLQLGVDRTALVDVLSTLGPLAGSVSQKHDMYVSGEFRPTRFSLDLMVKDLELCVAATEGDAALAATALDIARAAAAAGLGDEDYAALAGHLAGPPTA